MQICTHLMNKHNSKKLPLVKSFDWDLKFIIGSSSLSSHREQKATLMFDCIHDNQSEFLSTEINRKKIDEFIRELKTCIDQ